MTCKKALGYTLISSPFVAVYAYGGHSIGFGPITMLVGVGIFIAALMFIGTKLIVGK